MSKISRYYWSRKGGKLQFKSGFEDATYTTDSGGLGYIYGIDASAPSGINDWTKLTNGTYIPWAKFQRLWWEGGSWEIAADPEDAGNKVLHFHNTDSVGGGYCRTQWSLKTVNQWADDGTPNLYDKQFYRIRMYIPTEEEDAYDLDEANLYHMIWESHVWDPLDFADGENTRYGVYIDKFANEAWFHFRVVKQRPEGTTLWYNLTADPTWCDVNHAVPFGEWFTFDVFLKYHETNGEFYVAYQRDGEERKTVGHFLGQTKHDKKIHSASWKLYQDDDILTRLPGGSHQYFDDFEVWSDYPPGYWSGIG